MGRDGSSHTYTGDLPGQRVLSMLQCDEDLETWLRCLGSVSDDEPETPRNTSLLTPVLLAFDRPSDWMESAHVLPELCGSVFTVYLLCVSAYMWALLVAYAPPQI